MAHAYTPGLKVTEGMTIEKERRLPLEGEVLVETGATVKAEDIVAKADLPGNVQLLNVANLLSVPPEEIAEYMLKPIGETVSEDEIIATTKGLFGLFKSQARSPIAGTIESISDVTGQVILREPPIPVELKAYTDGTITETIPNEGVTVETYGTYIQGIFGVGGETVGNLVMVANSPNEELTAEQILPEHKEDILVGGALVTTDAIQKAIQLGVHGIIAGGIDDADLRQLLGYELGVAITGSEELGITLVITEGFGSIAMAERTFALLKQREGMKTAINGATQIRAGVVRPEILIPLVTETENTGTDVPAGTLEIGSPVRVIREPHFGKLGHVTELPIELQKLETEAEVRVLQVEFEDGKKTTLPRANVEAIEEQ
ncbi:hypothetical protein C6501_02425 [Candidatus Poribacteria bacterium]|nr:MAG: hypothetical protein C6501_02425 [Candidatus Poribacteria bacterium]